MARAPAEGKTAYMWPPESGDGADDPGTPNGRHRAQRWSGALETRPETTGLWAEGGVGAELDRALTDEELTALALADDLDRPIGDDALPYNLARFPRPLLATPHSAVMPGRYLVGWKKRVLVVIVTTLIVLEALGLFHSVG
ncbi:MAG: hypothetical protein JWM85_1031 [Acidimicrobiaceae bacterium]|nr:hypothetical protein [Acidimicrobiaceae bacterium]